MTNDGNPKIRVKNVLRLLAAVFIGLPLAVLLLVGVFNWTYILGAKVLLGPPGMDIVALERPLPEDHAAEELLQIAALVHPQHVELKVSEPPAWQERRVRCQMLMGSEREALAAWDAWLGKPGPYKLERPANVGWHSRLPLPEMATNRTPDTRAISRLGRVVACRALLHFAAGDYPAGRQDLRMVFALGDFLQQNTDILLTHFGLQLHRQGLQLIKRHLSAEMLRDDALLPDPDRMLEATRLAWGNEFWEGARFFHSLDTVRPWNEMSVYVLLGLYDADYLARLDARKYRGLLAHHLVKKRLGAFPVEPEEEPNWDEMGMVKWIHQPYSRMLASIAASPHGTLIQPGGVTGQTMDMVEAMRVVLAARRYQREHHRWPVQEADLVPRYLPSWPTSALTGEPLRWLADRSGVEVLNQVGRTPCNPTEPCRFPFAPPEPISAR